MEWDFSVWESPCACTLTAQSGDEAGLCLFVSCIHSLYLHAATHDTRQPLVTVDTKPLEVGKQTFVPVYVVGGRGNMTREIVSVNLKKTTLDDDIKQEENSVWF